MAFSGLLVVNAGSLPLVWHVRVLRHMIKWHVLRLLSPNKHLYMQHTSPIAQNPFASEITHNYWAGPDDCDFLGHLSNSSYAKNLDIVRMKVCVTNLHPFMLEGGFMPLAGADYAYLFEIPMFTSYEVRAKVAAWDEKWIYLYSEFITRPKVSKPRGQSQCSLSAETGIPGKKPRGVRADGTKLHCVAISRYVFKLGRITVPPRIALSICGFGGDGKNWEQYVTMKQKGTLNEFLRGGWKTANGWDLPEFEEQRVAGLEWCQKLNEGISEAASFEWVS
ncbi:hypothetical protein BXZ70DRAFT_1007472 [Cristinia sonorae]|uniref:Uncharacterized protein n=1 Tax=Cristinia sonorae TaxID=1940300 RepID=A0A8K0XQ57_9AGAR|nr:hypothetical protein BXZ70DRAFT_1007472 [Cristinia sonorae]